VVKKKRIVSVLIAQIIISSYEAGADKQSGSVFIKGTMLGRTLLITKRFYLGCTQFFFTAEGKAPPSDSGPAQKSQTHVRRSQAP
jgi:hypothetical protein